MNSDEAFITINNTDTPEYKAANNAKTKKLIIIGIIILVVLTVGGVATYFLTRDPSQAVEDEEPSLEFAAEGSKLAEIQFLISNGLTSDQYLDAHDKINGFVLESFPEAKYFKYVEDSLTFESNAEEEPVLSAEDLAEMSAAAATSVAGEEEVYVPDWAEDEPREDVGLGAGVLVFDMISDADVTITIKIEPLDNAKTVNVRIFDADGKKLY